MAGGVEVDLHSWGSDRAAEARPLVYGQSTGVWGEARGYYKVDGNNRTVGERWPSQVERAPAHEPPC